jgi:serine phosphatase RsbU (regulator of sigma subunit)
LKTIVRILLLLICPLATLLAQNHKIDSLRMVLPRQKDDTSKVNTLLSLAAELETTSPDSSLLLSRQALVISRKADWQKGIIGAIYDIGVYTYVKGDLNNAWLYVDSALIYSNEYKSTKRLNSIYNMLGNIASDQDKYAVGLDYYFKALALDSISGKKSIADLYNNIGLNYQDLGNYVNAEEYYFKALRMYEQENNQEGIATIYTNLGNLYDLQGDHKKGLEIKFKALKIDSAAGNNENLILGYQTVGNGFLLNSDYINALQYNYRSIELAAKMGVESQIYASYSNIGEAFAAFYDDDSTHSEITYSINGIIKHVKYEALLDSALFNEKRCIYYANKANNRSSLIDAYENIGDIYTSQKDTKQALAFYSAALNLADSLGVLQERMHESQVLGHAYTRMGNYEEATKYLNDALKLKDSLYGVEKQKAIGNIEAQFVFDKRLLEQKKENEKEQAVADEEQKRQKYVIATISLGLGIVLIFLTLLFRRYRLTNKQKRIIESQKKEVDAAYGQLNNAHAQLQEKDKDITDSIAYARKIQSAILPTEESMQEQIGDCFVLYKPRDIVSGDFYWFHSTGNKLIFAVVDCTGHGVPGAFMSMIGNSILNQVVIENKATEASDILNQMRNNLLKQLQQKGQESVSRDGMDMAIGIWDRTKNTLQYAGANSSLYFVRKNISTMSSQNQKQRPHGNDMLEILPDKQPIGYQEGKMESDFTTHTIQLQKNDLVYIASDGYQDQFGGEKNKKFTSRAFRDLLVSMADKPIDKQKQILNGTIETWKGAYAQTDDICVMGIRIS